MISQHIQSRLLCPRGKIMLGPIWHGLSNGAIISIAGLAFPEKGRKNGPLLALLSVGLIWICTSRTEGCRLWPKEANLVCCSWSHLCQTAVVTCRPICSTANRVQCSAVGNNDTLLCPCPIGEGHFRLSAVRLSAHLSVPCLDITREGKGLGSPNLAGWKPITRVTHEPI